MNNRIVITKQHIEEKEHLVMAFFEEGKLMEVSCENTQETSVLGNIYIGKIKRILPKINGCFVEIGQDFMTFLPFYEIKSPLFSHRARKTELTEGDELVVQVIRDAVSTKYPTVSTKLTLWGEMTVLTTDNTSLGVSKKISKEKREEFLNIFRDKKSDSYGLVIRTIAQRHTKEDILKDFSMVEAVYERICSTYAHRVCHSLLYQSERSYLPFIQSHLSYGLERIVTDDEEIYHDIINHHFLNVEEVQKYEDQEYPLDKLYGLTNKIEDALKQKVYLDSGAYLIIQPTEALTVIDVNSGRAVKGKDEGYYYRINIEAAKEVARQLRLRNISGICIVDFINMKQKEEQEKLISYLKKELAKDPIPAVFVDYTKLGLVEITRKKEKKPLWEQIR